MEVHENYGEKQYLVMMGGLYIKMVSLKIIGDWLTNSGWVSALVQADITSSGRADAIVHGSHITCSRYAHQITACALYYLQKKAYENYLDNCTSDQPMEISACLEDQSEKHSQCQFWCIALEIEITILLFVKFPREGNFPLYVETLEKLVPWMFVLDHNNYARWLPIHIRNMATLEKQHPGIFENLYQENL